MPRAFVYQSLSRRARHIRPQAAERLQAIPCSPTADVASDIDFLHTTAARADGPLRSTYDSAHEVIRAQRVVLDKAKAEPSADEAAYSQLVDRVDLALLASPRRSSGRRSSPSMRCSPSTPRSPRAAIERALFRPHDYLACECCDQVEGQLAASQPTTALVSGAVINVQDMWNAFQAVMGVEEQEENELLALFYRALAKLKYPDYAKLDSFYLI